MLQGKIASLPTAPATTFHFTAHTAKSLKAPIGKRICKGIFCNTHTDLSAAATSESEFPTNPTHPLHEQPQENRWSSLRVPSLPTPSFRVVIHHRHRILRRYSSPPNFSLRPFRHLPLHGKKPSSADCCTVTAWRNGKKNATKKRSLCRDRFNKIKHVSLRVLRQPWRRVP